MPSTDTETDVTVLLPPTLAVIAGVSVDTHEPSAGLGALSCGGETTLKLHDAVAFRPAVFVSCAVTVCVPSPRALVWNEAVPCMESDIVQEAALATPSRVMSGLAVSPDQS